jgi:hypothetical protein
MRSSLGVSALLLAILVLGALAQELFTPSATATAAQVKGESVTLHDRLTGVLKPRTEKERLFVNYVVARVENGQLPVEIVNAAFNYARNKKPYPFPYFQQVLPRIAAQAGYPLQ